VEYGKLKDRLVLLMEKIAELNMRGEGGSFDNCCFNIINFLKTQVKY